MSSNETTVQLQTSNILINSISEYIFCKTFYFLFGDENKKAVELFKYSMVYPITVNTNLCRGAKNEQ